MTVRYNKTVGVISIVLGALFGCLYFVIALAGGQTTVSPMVAGVLGILFGILFLSRPYFTLAEDNLTLYALLGPAKTVYSFPPPARLQARGKKIVIVQPDGKEQAVPLTAWVADPKDWGAFLSRLG